MSIVEKLHCDYCGRDESLPLNHVWTILLHPAQLEVQRGFQRSASGEHYHLCSVACLGKAVSRWAAELPISSSVAHTAPEENNL